MLNDFQSASPTTRTSPPILISEPCKLPERSQSQLESQWSYRSWSARRQTRYRTRVDVIVQDEDRTRVLARHDFAGGKIEEAVDAALEQVAVLMAPLTPSEILERKVKGYARTPLAEDVVLACGGKILATVQAPTGGDGPFVYRFPALTQR